MRESDELTRRFFGDELNAHVRAVLVAEIERRTDGRAYFTFNAINVLIDVDSHTVTLEDELDPGVEVTLPLGLFVTQLGSSSTRHGGV